jgi:L-lactate dehydrogenase (cytochrome)/(S)-mandelate dehydrogenase
MQRAESSRRQWRDGALRANLTARGHAARDRRMRRERAVNIDKAINIDDLRRMAKRRMPRIAFDFIEGGVEDEEGLAHNEAIYRRYRMVPRFLLDVARRDQSVTLFGRTYASPFGICPTGINGLFRRNSDLMLAEASTKANIPYIMSSVANSSLEEAVKIAPHMWFQVYGSNDRTVMLDMARRARDAGIDTLVVTVDVPLLHKRERNTRNGFTRPLKMKPSIVLESLMHTGWIIEFLRHGGIPRFENWAPYSPPGSSTDVINDHYGTQTPSANQTWRDFEEFRRLWPGNLVIKGVLHPDDAARAANIGANGILVSNHGARQLDRAVSPVEMLPMICAAVGDKVTILTDSGVRRGSDIAVARCLGAKAAFVGRATLYGVSAAGLPGALKAIEILRSQLDLTLGMLGCASLDELGPHVLFDSEKGQFLAEQKPAATVREFPKITA